MANRPTRVLWWVGRSLLLSGILTLAVGLVGMMVSGDGDGEAASADAATSTTPREVAPTEEGPATTATTAVPRPTTTATTQPDPERDVPALLATLEEAVLATDVDALIALLHPEVFEVFTEVECRERLRKLSDDTFDLEVRGVGPPAPFEWDSGAGVVTIESAIPVEVSRVRQGETVIQEIHLAYAEGRLRWFTTCTATASSSGD